MMVLALFGLGVMTAILFLQGFRVGGFYLDAAVLTALIPSVSAAPALRALGMGNRSPAENRSKPHLCRTH